MDCKHSDRTIGFYDHEAERLAVRYESLPFEEVHEAAVEWVPDNGPVLDIGAGSGRDAAWFAEKGYKVVAVEPADGMRRTASALHPNLPILWVDSRLPDLVLPPEQSDPFNLIWISAVWMHLPKSTRESAFRKIITFLRPGGRLVIILRHGPMRDDRVIHFTQAGELETLASEHGLTVLKTFSSDDCWRREGVSWETIVLQSPDDGEDALLLLRHIIINDNKPTTYKLALLRALMWIANSGISLVTDVGENDDAVAVPLGLIALCWIRIYKPLLENNILQKQPKRKGGHGFVKGDGFRALKLPAHGLQTGAKFTGNDAKALLRTMRDVCRVIALSPVSHITHPDTGKQIFVAHRQSGGRRGKDFTLDDRFLKSFGDVQVPRHLWQAMGRYTAWIEPLLVNKWGELTQGYEDAAGGRKRSLETHVKLLRGL